MDATKLKYLAALSMLAGHAAALLMEPGSLFYLLCQAAGQLAFPIFAWTAAESLRKSGNRKRYLLRLGLFALISEGPYLLAFRNGSVQCSIMVTYFLAAAAILLFDRLREKLPLPTALLPLLAALLLAEILNCPYGAMGVLLVAALYLADGAHRPRLYLVGLWSLAAHLIYFPFPALMAKLPAGIWTPDLPKIVVQFMADALPGAALCTLAAGLSIPLLARYNGTRGREDKWFFYWFYPIHLLILTALARILP